MTSLIRSKVARTFALAAVMAAFAAAPAVAHHGKGGHKPGDYDVTDVTLIEQGFTLVEIKNADVDADGKVKVTENGDLVDA